MDWTFSDACELDGPKATWLSGVNTAVRVWVQGDRVEVLRWANHRFEWDRRPRSTLVVLIGRTDACADAVICVL